MKKIIYSLLIFCPLLALDMPLAAQRAVVSRGNYVRAISSQGNNNWFDRYEKNSVDQIGLAIGLSTMGIGLEAVTSLSYKIDVRLGFTYMPPAIGLNKTLDVKDRVLNQRVGGYDPGYKTSFKPNFLHGHVMFDYYLRETKTFHISVGMFVGKSEVQSRGYLINRDDNKPAQLQKDYASEGWPNLVVDGRNLNIRNGRLDADIRLGAIVKPYVGIGFGRSIPGEAGMAVNFDIGVMLQASHSIYQNGEKVDKANYTSDAIDISGYTGFGVWPLVRMQFAFRAR